MLWILTHHDDPQDNTAFYLPNILKCISVYYCPLFITLYFRIFITSFISWSVEDCRLVSPQRVCVLKISFSRHQLRINSLVYRSDPISVVFEAWVNRWVHTSLVSRPQVYFNLTSDMNGSNFNLSSLLCSRGNVSCSKEPKYTSKSSSTHPYRRTYTL